MEEQITSFLYNHSDTGLVVIDALQKVRSCDKSGSMYASDYKDVSTLKSLADKYGICILLIHHLRKQAASDPFDQISGSNGLMGAADTTWVMQRKRTSKNADIILTGRDLDRRTLYLHEENCIWLLLTVPLYSLLISFINFIASMIASVCPSSTLSPTLT